MGWLGYVVGGALEGAGAGLAAGAKMEADAENERIKTEVLAAKQKELAQFNADLQRPHQQFLEQQAVRTNEINDRKLNIEEAAAKSRGENQQLRNQLDFIGKLMQYDAKMGGRGAGAGGSVSGGGAAGSSGKLDPASALALEQFALKEMPSMKPEEAAGWARMRAMSYVPTKDGGMEAKVNLDGSRFVVVAKLESGADDAKRAAFEKDVQSFITDGRSSHYMAPPKQAAKADEPGVVSRALSGLSGIAGGGGSAPAPQAPTSPVAGLKVIDVTSAGMLSSSKVIFEDAQGTRRMLSADDFTQQYGSPFLYKK